jgi:Holliday junction resolvase RusA-like endonuclease
MKFFIPCLPVAQPRPKATTINGHTRMYEAKKSHPIHEFKSAVKSAWHQAGAVKLQGEVIARLEFVFARPPKVPKKLGTGRMSKPTKPDADNLAKGVCDSLNGLAYDDDGQIVSLVVNKYRAAEGEVPGVHVVLESTSSPVSSEGLGRSADA